jgi:large conductance mechanosensitive channel
MKKLVNEFKEFAMKGNVIDLAVGVVIGGAFGKIVTSLVSDIFMPLLGLVTGKVNLAGLKYKIIEKTATTEEFSIKFGAFLQSIVDFLIIAFCIFMVIKFISVFKKKEEAIEEVEKQNEASKEELLLVEIRDLLKDIKDKQ